MGRIIIHIGTHKTGTTSIQKTLSFYRRRLRLNGIYYPDYTEIGKTGHYAHIGMANALGGDHPTLSQQDAETFFRHVQEKSGAHDVTLLSAEPLYRQTLGPVAAQHAASPAEYWEIRARYIARLRELVGPAEIVIVLRRQDEFAESMYQEHVKVTRYAQPFEQYLKEFWFHFLYDQQIAAWAQHFDTIRVVPFTAIKGGNITKAFLNAIGLAPGRIETVGMQNVGMPHDGVILKRFYNGTPLDKASLTLLAGAMTSDAFRQTISPGKRSFFASAAARQAFIQGFHAENTAAAQRAGLPAEALCETDIPDGLRYGDALDAAERQRLAATLEELLAGRLALPPMAAGAA